MKRGRPFTAARLFTALACSTLSLIAGCGSSSSGSGAGSSATTGTSPSSHPSSGGSSGGTSSSKGSSAGGLKVDTTPKFASPSPSEPVRSGTVQITYRNIAIAPDVVRAKVGSTVKWVNEDPQKCNVTSKGGPYHFASGDIRVGGTFQLKLTKPGTIHYECTYYPVTMNGTIEAVK